MTRLLNVLLLLFMPFPVFADKETGWGKVVEVWSGYQNGQVLFKLDIPHENPKSCGGVSFYAVNPDTADPAKFLSILLYAKASQQPVKLMLSETACQYNYPSALRVGVK